MNLQRVLSLLNELSSPFQSSEHHLSTLLPAQEEFVGDIAFLLQSIPQLRTMEEKTAANEAINQSFMVLLRADDMVFNADGIVGEGQLHIARSLREILSRPSFFFHVTLEEELKKLDFSIISLYLASISSGVERAYACNLRLVEWAVVFYTFIKMVHS